MIILWYFKFTRNLVFTNCPTIMLNIGNSSIRCREEEYQCTPTNPNFNGENRSSGLFWNWAEKNICHSCWWITQLDFKLKGRTDNISLKMMSVLSSGLWCHFSYQVMKFTGHKGGKYIQYRYLFAGEKIKQNKKRTWEKMICSFAIAYLQQMNATGYIDNG